MNKLAESSLWKPKISDITNIQYIVSHNFNIVILLVLYFWPPERILRAASWYIKVFSLVKIYVSLNTKLNKCASSTVALSFIALDDCSSPKIVADANASNGDIIIEGKLFLLFLFLIRRGVNNVAAASIASAAEDVRGLLTGDVEWEFTSLRDDPPYYPPIIVNEDGAHKCNNANDCVHF